MLEGLQHLPQPIIQHILNKSHERTFYPDVWNVSNLEGCLRKYYYTRKYGGLYKPNIRSLWNFYRGHLLDDEFSPLFPENQRAVTATRNGATIVGHFDFKYDNMIYDLKTAHEGKMYYLRKRGPDQNNVKQLQDYMELYDHPKIGRGRLLYMSFKPDPIQFDVPRDNQAVNNLWVKINNIKWALEHDQPSILPETWKDSKERWRCSPEYCEYRSECVNRR